MPQLLSIWIAAFLSAFDTTVGMSVTLTRNDEIRRLIRQLRLC